MPVFLDEELLAPPTNTKFKLEDRPLSIIQIRGYYPLQKPICCISERHAMSEVQNVEVETKSLK
jgi:hypothetical protein